MPPPPRLSSPVAHSDTPLSAESSRDPAVQPLLSERGCPISVPRGEERPGRRGGGCHLSAVVWQHLNQPTNCSFPTSPKAGVNYSERPGGTDYFVRRVFSLTNRAWLHWIALGGCNRPFSKAGWLSEFSHTNSSYPYLAFSFDTYYKTWQMRPTINTWWFYCKDLKKHIKLSRCINEIRLS